MKSKKMFAKMSPDGFFEVALMGVTHFGTGIFSMAEISGITTFNTKKASTIQNRVVVLIKSERFDPLGQRFKFQAGQATVR